ncbi:protein patched [Oratosquilla oratoria]|uniref:protein patched n=1 Tax=Oratosquilla oratoria TaxID=337810 RepID=UPI003F769E37
MAIAMVGQESYQAARTHSSSTKKPDEDLITRTSWADARTALAQIKRGRATGSRAALWLRTKLQWHLFQLGKFAQKHGGKVLFVALLVLATFCVGLKSATIVTDVEKLWVEEGGRLERELAYVSATLGEGAGSTKQMMIQTPRRKGVNVLHPSAVLAHLHVLKRATEVEVNMFDITWSLKDLCYAQSFPSFENYLIDQIFEKLQPCAIITPLDCFWEGSKLLGPRFPVVIPGQGPGVTWMNLNPESIVEKMRQLKDYDTYFPFQGFINFMKRAGITTAYQEKPCLDPSDPLCPATTPNKQSGQPPDVGAELTGGCYGFAGKYMHWPEDLIVGATTKNKTGHIKEGFALQSIVQLMGSKNLYEFWHDHYRVHYLDWSQDKAAAILQAWQTKFTEEVKNITEGSYNETRHYNIHPFSEASLGDLLRQFSEVSVTKLSMGYVLMVIYASLSLLKMSDPVNSQCGLGVAGVLLVAVTVAAGLGLCALLGLPFNASTTQILPFIALGLGVDDMFLLAHTFAKTSDTIIPYQDVIGEVLKRTGVSVVLTSVCNACAFFAAAIVPIPALRMFCLQAGLLVLVSLVAMLVVFPAVMSLDLRRRHARRIDLFCCIPGPVPDQVISLQPSEESQVKNKHSAPAHRESPRQCQVVPYSDTPKKTAVTRALSTCAGGTVTSVMSELSPPKIPLECWVTPTANPYSPSAPSIESLATVASTRDLVDTEQNNSGHVPFKTWLASVNRKFSEWSVSKWAREVYGPFVTKTSVKVVSVIGLMGLLGTALWGMSRVTDGLDLTDIVPRHTPEFAFLNAQQKYFGFYNMFAVTQGNFEYPTNQQLLHEYHETFTRVHHIIKNDDGGLPEFWLSLFRDWLIELQKAFDRDFRDGCITQEKWFHNASDEGVLAYKLLVQTGHVDNPIDRSLVTQVRLVDGNGIINPKAFYNYLTAWVSNDALAYSASQADLQPEPRIWIHERHDYELKIPKSPPLVYAQLPFYLHKLSDTAAITEMIESVRSICIKFKEKGLPNFPTGVPFTFWEQYIKLRFFLLLALLAVLVAVFLVLTVVLMNMWAAAIVVFLLATMVVELFGIMGIIGVKLSAVPAVLLIVAVGLGVEFMVHVTVGFLTALGDRNRRVMLSLEHMTAPVVHGAISTLLGVIMLLFSEFDFIRRYFFYVLFALTLLGMVNGLLFLPVVLSLVGPPAEVVPRGDPDRLPMPSPPPSPNQNYSHSHGSRESSSKHGSCRTHGGRHSSHSRQDFSSSSRRGSGLNPRFAGSNLSLTTITEETNSSQSLHSSHEIVVEPQVVVETTTYTGGSTVSSSSPVDGSSHTESSTTSAPHVTTKVTATAKVKVELHAPLPGTVEPNYRSVRRSSRRGSSSVINPSSSNGTSSTWSSNSPRVSDQETDVDVSHK